MPLVMRRIQNRTSWERSVHRAIENEALATWAVRGLYGCVGKFLRRNRPICLNVAMCNTSSPSSRLSSWGKKELTTLKGVGKGTSLSGGRPVTPTTVQRVPTSSHSTLYPGFCPQETYTHRHNRNGKLVPSPRQDSEGLSVAP